tara:strand:+ start:22 stop:1095 length:1074 start_codon:yes stop_codon:yes gene_type:complete
MTTNNPKINEWRTNATQDQKDKIKEKDRLRKKTKRDAAKKARLEAGVADPVIGRPRVRVGGTVMSTIDQNKLRIKKIASIMGASVEEDVIPMFLQNTASVYAHVRQHSDNANTQSSYISSVLATIRDGIKGGANDLWSLVKLEYKKILDEIQSTIKKEINDNIMSIDDSSKWFDLDLKNKYRKKLDTNMELLIFDLYTLLPPRHSEYRSLEIEFYNPKALAAAKKDKKNILFITKTGRISRISLNDYKGSVMKGEYIIPSKKIPLKLKKSLMAVVGEKPDDDFFFPVQYRSPDEFSRLVTKVFTKATGRAAGINILRKIYASNQLEDGNLTENQKIELANSMGTSVSMLMSSYRKVE